MDRAAFDGIELEYEMRGAGEHVVFVHHGAGADWFSPLFDEPALAGRFRLLRYHRAGYVGSSRLTASLTFEEEAARFRGLMRHFGIGRAHVVGHSASACIALQIAADVPEVVHSLAVLEPALMAVQALQRFLGLSSCTAPATPELQSTRFFEERVVPMHVRFSRRSCPAPSSRRARTPTRSSATSSPRCGSGRSVPKRRAPSSSLSSP